MDANTKKEKIEQMKKGLKIARRVAAEVGKIGAKVGKKAAKEGARIAVIGAKEGARITVIGAKAGYRGAQKAYQKYKKLDDNAKRKLHRGLLIAGGVLTFAGVNYFSWHKDASPEPEKKIETPTDTINASLTKVYKITDEESFKQLYEDALPLIQASLLPIEIYKKSGYDDRGGKNFNSIAIGLFYFPKDGNPENPDWISTKKYLQNHPNTQISLEQSFKLIDAWCRYREQGGIKGGVYQKMFQRLKGAELTVHQFAACFNCTFNSEASGFKFCDFVRENYKDPVKCAHYLTTLDPKNKSFIDGILVRHTAEACLYMYPDYAQAVYSFKMKDAINSKGKSYTVTSINQTTPSQCYIVRDDLAKGRTVELERHKRRIMKYMCKGGYTVGDLIRKNIKDENKQTLYLCYAGPEVISYEETKADMTYSQALKEYNEGNYDAALEGFQQLRSNGYDGADLRCDIALTHYKLGHYEECISECRAVLETGEEQLYPYATYNAGKAYEAMKNYERARLNYDRSLIMAEKNNMNDSVKKVYQNAVKRMDVMIKSKQSKAEQTIIKNNDKKTNVSSKPKSSKAKHLPRKTSQRGGRG